ncbi:unnamed protein product, partial [Allacma fusca]
MTISSVGGMEHAKLALDIGLSQKSQLKDKSFTGRLSQFKSSGTAIHNTDSDPQGDFPMPKGEDKTNLNVYTGDTRIRNMATVVQQGSSGHTTGDFFLDKTKMDQYNVVRQTFPDAKGDTLGSDIQIPLVILSQGVCMSKLPEKPNAQKNGERKNIDGYDPGSVVNAVGDIKSRLPENTKVRNINGKIEIAGNQVGIIETPESSDVMNVYDLANEK